MLTSIRGLVAASILTVSGLVAMPALADETDPPSDLTVTGSASVVSQYRFRGLSQSDNNPAIQGAITLSHSSGFYIGTWGSSTTSDFSKTPIAPGGTEIDVFGGWTKPVGGVTLDVGAYGYLYPNATAGNYYEFYGSVAKTLGPVTGKVGVYYAPAQKVFNYNFTSPTRHNTYVYGELSSGIPGTPLTVHSHLGHTGGGFDYGKQYLDYSVGVAYKWKMLTLDASLVGTNVSKTDVDTAFGCTANAACVDYFHRPAKTVGVVSLTASF
ncbi:MAG: TorF family putative porin [Sphingomonadales bacterium]|nr:TorF family putative porin [Sphingomonadales bacterium]